MRAARPARARARHRRRGERRGAARGAARGGAPRHRGDPPGALALPLLHGLPHRGRRPRPRSARGAAREDRRLAARRRRRERDQGARAHRRSGRRALHRHAVGTIDRIEIANMHEQTQQREERLLAAVPDAPTERATTGVVAVVAGDGNRRLFESLARTSARCDRRGRPDDEPVDRRPARGGAVARRRRGRDPAEQLNVLLAAEHAAANASTARRDRLRATRSPAGLAAMVAFDGQRTAAENAAEMREAVERSTPAR